jgi:hypothetical protein
VRAFAPGKRGVLLQVVHQKVVSGKNEVRIMCGKDGWVPVVFQVEKYVTRNLTRPRHALIA